MEKVFDKILSEKQDIYIASQFDHNYHNSNKCIIWSCKKIKINQNVNIIISEWNWVPLKLSSSAEFMINLSIQNFIPFLVLHLFPLKTVE